MNYWVGRDGQQHGPYAVADLRRMIAAAQVAPTDLCWTEGMANWAPVSQVLPAEAPAYAPPPPPAAVQPAYVQPAYVQPAYSAPAAVPTAGPMPPAMHWAAVFLIGMVTFGIFTLVWVSSN